MKNTSKTLKIVSILTVVFYALVILIPLSIKGILAVSGYSTGIIRLASILMMICVVVLAACGDAEPAEKIFDTFKSVDGIVISGLKDKNMREVVIPNKIDKVPVTVINREAFEYCADLTDIRLPKELTYIDEFAFSHCISLKEVNIPDSVTSIEPRAFEYCSSLKKITWGGNTYTDMREFENYLDRINRNRQR